MEKTVTFTVSETDRGKRLDHFVKEQTITLSRSRIQQLIEEGRFLVNGRPRKPGAKIRPGDQVTGSIPAPIRLEVRPENIPLDILHEDGDIIVVNKPPGMVVHPAPGVFSGTLVNGLLFHCKDLSGINGVLRPGIVHRLDKLTSGVIVAAKNDLAHDSLALQFKSRTIDKRYLAIVYGHLPLAGGIIDASLGRHPTQRTRVSVRARNPKPAVTRWKTLWTTDHFTFLEVFPKTGRTHQIRAHLYSIGYPILGDPVYCGAKGPKLIEDQLVREKVGKFRRQALHASDIRFVHPATGETVSFHAPLAEDMGQLIEFIETYDV